ncbi:MAG TPA: hypothetical protein PK725_12530 [Rhodocyclaceae bacterium]|nr:hypothetical protein [Rhodocyclaceae bacterium]
MSHGHPFDAVLDYPLPRITRLLVAVERQEAARNLAMLQAMALGTRASPDDLAAAMTERGDDDTPV